MQFSEQSKMARAGLNWWRAVLRILLWPVIQFHNGRGRLAALRYLILPLNRLCSDDIVVSLPYGATARLSLREVTGIKFLLGIRFEEVELLHLGALLNEGDVAFDVGANVGIFTTVFGRRVGASGKVVAVEPLDRNLRRLSENITRNHLQNVDLINAAAGDRQDRCLLSVSGDGAFSSVTEGPTSDGKLVEVDRTTLDEVWRSRGRPAVKVLKMDIEGAEPVAIAGAVELLRSCGPTLLIEANDFHSFNQISKLLEPLGYEYQQVPGFRQWNTLWTMRRPPTTLTDRH